MANTRYERYQYIYGNTARAVEVEVPVETPKEREQHRVRKESKPVIRSNRAVLEFDGRFTMTVAVAVFAVVALCITYLFGQSQLNQQAKEVASKRTKLAALVSENHAKESNLDKKTDLDEIRTYAAEELGMIEPSEQDTIYYEGTPSDYVRQYAEIDLTE